MDKKDKPKRKRIEDLLENLLNQKKYVYEFTLSKDSDTTNAVDNAIRDLERHGYSVNGFYGLNTFKYESEIRFEENDRISIGLEYFYIRRIRYDILKRRFTAFLSLSEK